MLKVSRERNSEVYLGLFHVLKLCLFLTNVFQWQPVYDWIKLSPSLCRCLCSCFSVSASVCIVYVCIYVRVSVCLYLCLYFIVFFCLSLSLFLCIYFCLSVCHRRKTKSCTWKAVLNSLTVYIATPFKKLPKDTWKEVSPLFLAASQSLFIHWFVNNDN